MKHSQDEMKVKLIFNIIFSLKHPFTLLIRSLGAVHCTKLIAAEEWPISSFSIKVSDKAAKTDVILITLPQLRCTHTHWGRLTGSILDFLPASFTINQLRVQQNSLHRLSARWEWHFEVSINQHIHSVAHFSPKCAFCSRCTRRRLIFPGRFALAAVSITWMLCTQSARRSIFLLFLLRARCSPSSLFSCLPATNCK